MEKNRKDKGHFTILSEEAMLQIINTPVVKYDAKFNNPGAKAPESDINYHSHVE